MSLLNSLCIISTKCRPPKNSGTCRLGSVRTHNPRRYSIFTSFNDNDNESFRDNNYDNGNMLKSLGVCQLESVRTHNPRRCIIFTSLNDNDNGSFRDNNSDNDFMLKSLGACRFGVSEDTKSSALKLSFFKNFYAVGNVSFHQALEAKGSHSHTIIACLILKVVSHFLSFCPQCYLSTGLEVPP